MSADKRRKILIGFGGLAVVLVAVIAYVSPTFRNENASGAIGAVQKHRAPQIAQKDVILGGEQFRQEQKVAYGDYLSDAASLRQSAAALSAQSADAKSQIDNQEANVESQYVESARATVDAMQALMSEDAAALGKASLANVDADLNALESALANAKLDSASAMESMNRRIQNLVNTVDSAFAAASYEMAEEALGKASAQLSNLDEAQAALGRAAAYLDVASSLDLKYRMAHLEQMAKESKAIENVEVLMAKSAIENARAELNNEVVALEQAALDNMRAIHNQDIAEAAALGKVSAAVESLARGLDNLSSTENAQSLDQARKFLDQLSRDVRENKAQAALELKGQLQALQGLDQAARTESFVAFENQLASASQQ